MNLKQEIIDYAKSLGFDDTKFAQAQALDAEFELYKSWIDNSYHSEMHYLENYQDKRHDVRLMLDQCKSVIVFAHNYKTDFDYIGNPNYGKLARYSWGDDYHIIIKDKLQKIVDFIQSKQQVQSKCYVDTAPILERQWARKAGIGWQGKNGNIINKSIGSFFFIGIILTQAQFDYDNEIHDHCGSCKRCILACPTNAIIADKVIDSNKCISYATIEAKPDAEISKQVKSGISNRLFGCDICQEVCPWNAKKIFTLETAFKPRYDETSLDLNLVKEYTQEFFSARFKNSPVKRTKLSGIKRSADIIINSNK